MDRLNSQIPQERHDDFFNHLYAQAQITARDYIPGLSEENVWEAYLTFRSDYDEVIVLKGINEIRGKINSPPELEIILYSQRDQIPKDSNLTSCWNTIEKWVKVNSYGKMRNVQKMNR